MDLPRISMGVRDAAAAAGVSEDTIRAAVREGSLVAHWVGAKATKPVIRAVELDAWIASLPTQRGGTR